MARATSRTRLVGADCISSPPLRDSSQGARGATRGRRKFSHRQQLLPPAHQEITMNALPRTPIASRLQAAFAAAFLTLTMLSVIDQLAASDGSSAYVAQAAAASAPSA
jgi:hypothetical protein